MKKITLIFSALLFIGQSVSAQYDLTITYDATQGVSSLGGAAKVYIHSGGNDLPGPLDGSSWNYVVGNLVLDDGVGEMTNIGPDLWAITFDPLQYYSLAPNGPVTGASIQRIGMIFRNESGTATGKDANGQEIYMDLTGAAPAVFNSNGTSFGGVNAVITPSSLGGFEVVQSGVHSSPNPFSSYTVFSYRLNRSSSVSFSIFDLNGRKVVGLFEGRQDCGLHQLKWMGDDNSGSPLPDGVYIFSLLTEGQRVNGRILIMR